MTKITVRLLNRDQGRFQVIGRNVTDSSGHKHDMSTTFYACSNDEFKAQLDKLKSEYGLTKVVMGKNSKDEVLVQLI
jgi:hypothetical protein